MDSVRKATGPAPGKQDLYGAVPLLAFSINGLSGGERDVSK